ncbi:hypothetical protein OSTOST_19072, partial [Ostertagia ostertagi]
MRGPPPAWMPPHPPDRDTIMRITMKIRRTFEKEGWFLLGLSQTTSPTMTTTATTIGLSELSSLGLMTQHEAPSLIKSYEMSLSQQRRSAMREPLAPSLDDWTSLAEGQTVLHKNADGAYYIPSGS